MEGTSISGEGREGGGEGKGGNLTSAAFMFQGKEDDHH